MQLTAVAQALYGSLVGNVTDQSGAPVGGATVNITSKATGQSRTTTTNDAGLYSFPTIPSAVYALEVKKPGFTTATEPNVNITVNNVVRADMALQVGAVTESIVVGATTSPLQTDRSEVRSEVATRELEELPVPLGRNYQQIFRTLPGFNPPENAHSIPTNPSRALQFNVNGASQSSNNTRIDGASSINAFEPHVAAYVPALESIETVNVVTNSFDAEQGLAGGAAISVHIKSGTNDLHGSAFEYHADQHLKAQSFFNPPGHEKPKLVYNQEGGTIGGPILKNKLFYFLSYEGTFDRRNSERFATVPTAAIRAGNMSGSSRPIYDPRTGDAQGADRTPFAGNIVPDDRISPIARKIIELMPLPNIAGRLTNNYFATAPFLFDRHTGDAKVNYNLSPKLTLTGRLGLLHFDSYNQQTFGDILGGPPIGGGNPGYGEGNTYSVTVAATYVATPRFIVDTYFGWIRMGTSSKQPRLEENIGQTLGIPGTNGTRVAEGGWPMFQISNYTTVGINENFMPYTRRDPQYNYVANANWTAGTHNVRFGFEVYRQHLNQSQAEFGNFPASGGFIFTGGPTLTRGGPSSTQYNTFASFLLGLPTRLGRVLQSVDEFTVRAWLDSLYIRDQWNVTPHLTLSYGTRWEYIPFPTRADRGLETYNPETNQMFLCGVGATPSNCGNNSSWRNFAPRLGAAWRPTERWVLRAGYGITTDPYTLMNDLRTNYPLLVPLEIQGPNSYQPAGTLATGIPTPVAPDLSTGVITVPPNYDLVFVGKDFHRGYLQSWNVTVQKQLPFGLVGQAGYIATREVRHMGTVDINAGQIIGAGESGRPLFQRFGRTATTNSITNVGTFQYNGLQATASHRFAHGAQFNASYTWAHTIGIAGVNHSNDAPEVQALQYFRKNRALAAYDRPQNFQITSLYELPFGRGRTWLNSGGFAAALLGGWQVNNVLSFIAGDPFTVYAPGDSLDLPGSNQTADLIDPNVAKLGGTGPGQKYYSTSSFAPVEAARFGNMGFNNLRAPGIANWDFGIFREFQFNERVRLQFRGESFNFSNTPHFGVPDNDVSSDSFMEISSTRPVGRDVDERQFRFGLRLSF